MTAPISPTPDASADALASGETPQSPTRLPLFVSILLKVAIVATGLVLGGFLGVVIALFSGLIDFKC
ncbi:hypothetical protein [Andreprevotia chitinilytica]|uniref:hypothetical protein n=1 Tax=Andreprevotia chitinilytica TaxID=396808 RepID=UPI0005558263|nr:hypothetical protein [Andreprevotia chitinilytica]